MKRLIFTLLYSDGYFMLSRNFRLQKVGDINWLFANYDLMNLTNYIDELIILNISKKKIKNDFLKTINLISQKTFIPIAVGGFIENISDTEKLLKAGADKIIINSLFFEKPEICKMISDKYGKQFLVGSIDYLMLENKINVYQSKTKKILNTNINKWIDYLSKNGAGEVILQSIDRDGTGFGLEKKILKNIKKKTFPIILMGGVGTFKHIEDGFKLSRCDAISTANLFNFIGDEFINVRKQLEVKFNLPKKGSCNIKSLNNSF